MKDIKKTAKPADNHRHPVHKRKNLSLYYLMVFSICLIIFLILARTVFFNVNEYVVSGNSIYTTDTILSAGGLREGRNMYGINIDKTEKKIMEKLVYVEDIEIKRKLPDKVNINVTEARAFACCEYGGNKYAIITKSGRYLETEQLGARAGLILIKGMELKDVSLSEPFTSSDDMKKEIILDLLEAIYETCDGKITEIDITDRTNITMKYEDRIDIKFGSSLDYEYKLRYITAIIEENLDPEAEGEIDYHSSSAGASFIEKSDLALNEAERQEALNAPSGDETDENGEGSDEGSENG